ncbi:glutathionylspermidine synthase family protein [Paenibacillus sp. S-12]|uniref:glutathionylspermidine synthase family protein n=1 Tax=unclassified Paenibacillus TaxID=185978 RepID=UPI0025A0D143|nr:glutathionylspermidine synthase family protein [Paenibacillus sp. S-12]
MKFEILGRPHADRAARVDQLKELGFTWADIGEEQYWIDQVIAISEGMAQELLVVSAKLWNIFDKTARFVIGRRDIYALLSIPEVLWDGLDRIEPKEFGKLSKYARFDFAIDDEGAIKLLELNADTPTGYVEAAVATPWMCEQYGLATPNVGMAGRVKEAWADERPEYAACVAYGEHAEDSGTIEMLVKHSELQISCIDCLDMWIDEGEVKVGQQTIRSLFALYPKEWMGIDDGGEALAYSIETDRIKILNSPHAIILQSKGLQAVIWAIHELGSEMYTQEEHAVIEHYMLPTYNKAIFDGSYVSKSMFGREGGSVRLFDGQGNMEVEDKDGFDTSCFFSRVFQKRAELASIELSHGTYRLLTGIFVINGVPCGILGRAGGLITGNNSQFIAIGVKK